jgi:hypothetical protein
MTTFSTHHRLILTMTLLLAPGCSPTNEIDYGKVNLVSVGGNVMLDGTPLAAAVITFEDPETGTFSFARTDASGNYTLQFDSQANGVIPGKKVVEISTVRNVLGLAGEDGEEGGEPSSEEAESSSEEGDAQSAQPRKMEAVPACYNKESKLTVEVTSSSSTFNFDLKSDCSTTGALN